MNLNHETTQTAMVGSAGLTAGGGGIAWLNSNSSLITLALIAVATLVTVLSFVLNHRLNLREDARKEALYRKEMGLAPDKIEGTDNGPIPKDYPVD